VSYEEKNAWRYLVIGVVIPIAYFAIILQRVSTTPVSEIAYQPLLLGAIGLAIVAAIVLAILTSILFGSKDDRADQRDTAIGRRGDTVGFYVMSIATLGALALALVGAEQFWIANAIYAAFVISAIVSTVVKLIAYRRGF